MSIVTLTTWMENFILYFWLAFTQQSKFTYRVVLDEVTTWDETSAMCTNGVCPLPSRALTMDGPLPHTVTLALTKLHSCKCSHYGWPPTSHCDTGIDQVAFLQANFTRDNTWFVDSTPIGSRDIFQVCIIWVHIPVFPLRFRELITVSKLKGEGGWQTADVWKSFTFSVPIPRNVTILHCIVSVIWKCVKLLSSNRYSDVLSAYGLSQIDQGLGSKFPFFNCHQVTLTWVCPAATGRPARFWETSSSGGGPWLLWRLHGGSVHGYNMGELGAAHNFLEVRCWNTTRVS
jgi:hypothetical protein